MSLHDNTISIAIAVVRRDDCYLIGRRAADGPLPNYWEFPGGKVHPDELPADAAVRECREETGLAVRVGNLLAEVEHTCMHGRLRLYFFSCELMTAESQPASRFQWVPAGELGNYEFPAANRAIVAQLMAI